ncbi:hypothetical protein DFH06DRAFT_1141999 [Mycena polygramma]|nr:hypothetical protein DFH06DRAFT_1141999 [Mycena polygramma]
MKKNRRQASVTHTCNPPCPADVVRVLSTPEAPRSGADNADTTYRRPANYLKASKKKPPVGTLHPHLQCAVSAVHFFPTSWRRRCDVSTSRERRKMMRKSRQQAHGLYTWIGPCPIAPCLPPLWLPHREGAVRGADNSDTTYRHPATGLIYLEKPAGRHPPPSTAMHRPCVYTRDANAVTERGHHGASTQILNSSFGLPPSGLMGLMNRRSAFGIQVYINHDIESNPTLSALGNLHYTYN